MRKIIHFIAVLFGCAAASLNSGRAEIVQVTVAPRLKPHEQGPFFVVGDSKRTYYLLASDVPLSLDTNQVYTFTIRDDASVFIENPFNGFFYATLIKVQRDGKAIYDIEVCQLHNVKMEQKEVRVIYGLYRRAPDAPSAEIERQLFPHQQEFALGGCVGGTTGPKTEKRYVCGQCKVAYEKWKKDNSAKRNG